MMKEFLCELEKEKIRVGRNRRAIAGFIYHWIRGDNKKKNYKYYYQTELLDFSDYQRIYRGVEFPGLKDTGILLNGLIRHKEYYTINTIRWYRMLYPHVCICLSAWAGDLSAKEKDEIRDLDVHIIEQEDKYKNLDKGHLANQIISGRVGVDYLKRKGIHYIFRSRTDVRVEKADFLIYFKNLIKTYQSVDIRQNERLVAIAMANTLVNIPFHMSDLAWFGSTDELTKMYSINWRSQEDRDFLSAFANNMEKISKFNVAFHNLAECSYYSNEKEILGFISNEYTRYLLLNSEEICFAKGYASEYFNIAGSYEDILNIYHKFIKDYCIVVDQDEIGMHLNKFVEEVMQMGKYEQRGRVSHSIWIDMQNRSNDGK